MALFVIPVPSPAAGHDWTYTVPGQYIEHITAVSATLTTVGATPTVMVDSSGNANDGIYHNGTGGNPLHAGAFSGANAALWQWPGSNIDNRFGEIDSGIDVGLAYSFDCWVKGNTPVGGEGTMFSHDFASAGTSVQFAYLQDGTLFYAYNGSIHDAETATGVFPMDGNFHHVGLVDNHVAVPIIYLDGVAQTLVQSFVTPSIPGFAFTYAVGRFPQGTSQIDRGFYGQPAFYQSALAAGRFAAHAAANSSLTAYNTAVLADSPINYYELADSAGTGRQVTIDITDGTHKVVEVPTGFVDVATAGPYAYSWQPNLNSSTQTPTGRLTTVAIPDLILPAGYTVGTRTLDLQSGDQWSAVNIWWDDTYMQIVTGLADYHYPPGAYYVYQQVGV